jgi:hypothetical protein
MVKVTHCARREMLRPQSSGERDGSGEPGRAGDNFPLKQGNDQLLRRSEQW